MQKRAEHRRTALAVTFWLSSLRRGCDIFSSECLVLSLTKEMGTYTFCLQVPVLFNGCRSGEIFSIDLRQRGRRDHNWKASRFHQQSAITSVRVLQDENYLLAADMLGQVSLGLCVLIT